MVLKSRLSFPFLFSLFHLALKLLTLMETNELPLYSLIVRADLLHGGLLGILLLGTLHNFHKNCYFNVNYIHTNFILKECILRFISGQFIYLVNFSRNVRL